VKFPFAPLEPLIDAKWQPATDRETCSGYAAKTARVLNVHTAMVGRWRREGLNEQTADRVACALGYHPGLVWPEWWTDYKPEHGLLDAEDAA
jgi:hypothetical protein